jgi:hypothetical protein
MDIQQNKFRKWLYLCVFDTPTKHKETFVSGEIRVGRDNYLKLQVMRELEETSSDDGLSSPVVDTEMLQARAKTSIPLPTTKVTQAKAKAPTLTIPGTQEDTHCESTSHAALSIVDEDKDAAAVAAEKEATEHAPEERSNSETTCAKGTGLSMVDKGETAESMAVGDAGTQEDTHCESTANAALSKADEDKDTTGAASGTEGTEQAPEEPTISETTGSNCTGLYINEKGETVESMAVDNAGEVAGPGTEKIEGEDPAPREPHNVSQSATEQPASGTEGTEQAPEESSGTEGTEQAQTTESVTVDNAGEVAGLDTEKIEGEHPGPREPPNVSQSATEQSAESMEVHKCGDAGGPGTGVVKAPQELTAEDNGGTATFVVVNEACDAARRGDGVEAKEEPPLQHADVVHSAQEPATAQVTPPTAQGISAEDEVAAAESMAVDETGDGTTSSLLAQEKSRDTRGSQPYETTLEEGSMDDAGGSVCSETNLGAGSMAKVDAADDARLSLAREIRLALDVTKGIAPEAPVGHTDGTLQSTRKRKLRHVLREIAEAKKQGNYAEVKRLRKVAAKILQTAKIVTPRTSILAKTAKKKRKAPNKEVHMGESIGTNSNTNDYNVETRRGHAESNPAMHADKKRSREKQNEQDGTQKKKKLKRGPTPPPHEDNELGNEDSEDELGNEDLNYDEEGDEGTEWNNEEWYWDQKYCTWVFTGSKRIRRRDLTNKLERNWILGMRRNWTAK